MSSIHPRSGCCPECGTKLVFTPYIRRRDGTLVYPRGSRFFVFCPNKRNH